MKVVVLGGSGFIGSALVKRLAARGDEALVPTRRPKSHFDHGELIRFVGWDGEDPEILAGILEGRDAVVNLLGENISGQRWNPAVKRRILESRLRAGAAISDAFRAMERKPRVCIQASAAGYYGSWDDLENNPARGEDAPSGMSFLADVARRWEESTAVLENMGVRRCVIRTAAVLGPGGGVLAKLAPWFRACLGCSVGSGRQPFSWIHIDDEARAILFLLDNPDLEGAFNLVAPDSRSMDSFTSALAGVLDRPLFFRAPAFLLRLILGEMAQEVLLTGQNIAPRRLEETGFVFAFPRLEDALEASAG